MGVSIDVTSGSAEMMEMSGSSWELMEAVVVTFYQGLGNNCAAFDNWIQFHLGGLLFIKHTLPSFYFSRKANPAGVQFQS